MTPRPALSSQPCISAATVVVLFAPTEEDLAHLAAMASCKQSIFAVVNACNDELAAQLPVRSNIRYIRNEANAGLAHALNQGLTSAMASGVDYALLLDQDSRPDSGMRDRLVATAANIEATGRRIACVAPALVDRKATTAKLGKRSVEQVTSGTLATSGTLITRAAWDSVGPMWKELFIDGIDHEWCFRARARGFETVLAPDVTMSHDMGEGAIALFGRFRPVHRSPLRHYFIVRNTFWLARRGYVPLNWRISELLKLCYRAPAYIAFSTHTRRTVRNLWYGLVDGLRSPGEVSLERVS